MAVTAGCKNLVRYKQLYNGGRPAAPFLVVGIFINTALFLLFFGVLRPEGGGLEARV
jgi:hypothetical protein